MTPTQQNPPTIDDLIALVNKLTEATLPDEPLPDEVENSPCLGDFQMHRNGIHRWHDYAPIAPYGTIPDVVFYESVGEQLQAQGVGPLLVLRLNKRTKRAVELWVGEIDSDIARTLPKSVLEPHRALCAWLKENSSGEIPVAIVDALDISSANPFIRRHGSYVELCCRPTKLASDAAITALRTENRFPQLLEALQRLAAATEARNNQTFENRRPRRPDAEQRSTVPEFDGHQTGFNGTSRTAEHRVCF